MFDPLEADETIDKMTDAAITCRDLSHSWSLWYTQRVGTGYERGLRCRACNAARIEVLDGSGYLTQSRRYLYPEGYRVKGLGRIGSDFRARVRLRQMQALTDEEG